MTKEAEEAFRKIAKHFEIERVPNSEHLYEITNKTGDVLVLNEDELAGFVRFFAKTIEGR